MAQANIDLGILQETKCTDIVYTRASAGYRVVATDAPSRHRGRIALFYREGADFAVEEVRPYGPNVISFEVVTGRRLWYIIGCYLAPDDARTIERVITALGDQPRGTALIVAGGPQHGPGRYGERQERDRDCGGDYGSEPRGHDGALPAKEEEVGKRTENVEHGEDGEGHTVSDGLHPGD